MINVDNENGRVFDVSVDLKDNAMLKFRPDLFDEWDFEKNDLDVYKVSKSSAKIAWWIGRCGHEWQASVGKRSRRNHNCPYCSGHRILKGFNDMWTTNPTQANFLLNPEDGYLYMQSSNNIIAWKCQSCEEVVDRSINHVNRKGFSCALCSDGISFAEKVIYNILRAKGLLFKKEMIFDWAKNKRYDFYLYEHNAIIETHGIQHKDGGFKGMGGRTLQEEQDNDNYKKALALTNNIYNYIEIDASNIRLDAYREEILKSNLSEIINIDDICWEEIYKKSSKSMLIDVCDYWSNEEKNISKIAEHFGINRSTVGEYLKRGADMNICEYTIETSISNSSRILKRSVVQLTLSGEYVATWESLNEAKRNNNLKSCAHITSSCRGIRNYAYGYKWMYLEDYEITK